MTEHVFLLACHEPKARGKSIKTKNQYSVLEIMTHGQHGLSDSKKQLLDSLRDVYKREFGVRKTS